MMMTCTTHCDSFLPVKFYLWRRHKKPVWKKFSII